MTLNEIAEKSVGKDGFKFKRESINVIYRFRMDKKVETLDGNHYELTRDDLIYAQWQIICDHPKSYVQFSTEKPFENNRCAFCGREVEVQFKDKSPPLPEKLSPVKMTKREPREDELCAHMAAVRSVNKHHGIFIEPGLA